MRSTTGWYTGIKHVCFADLPGMRERTLLLGGFSKDYAMTGWRIGFVAGPAEILKGLLRIHQYTVMSAPTMAQVGRGDGPARRRRTRAGNGDRI